MKHSETYRQAAKVMEDQVGSGYETEYSCCAIGFVAGAKSGFYSDHKLAHEYAARFADTQVELQQRFMGLDEEDQLNARILALCFMAAISEDEERRKRSN